MILTKELFEQGKSSNGGWNKLQLNKLGVPDFVKGWARTIIGKDFSPEAIKEFLDLKDYHFKYKTATDNTGSAMAKIAIKNKLISFQPVIGKLPYKEQYLHPNWQKLRLVIFKRDGYACINCGSKDKTLHAHHMKYLPDKFIWEVPAWYLVTLCEDCHSKEHGRDLTIKK